MQISGISRGAREMQERLRSALHRSGVRMPLASLSINVAPQLSGRRASELEFSCAAATLLAIGMTPPGSLLRRIAAGEAIALFGELSLSGELLPVSWLSRRLWLASIAGFALAIVPEMQAQEAQAAGALPVLPARALCSLWEERHLRTLAPAPIAVAHRGSRLEGALVRSDALRAATLAAAGWHGLLFLGPPGVGKSAMAAEIGALLPAPDQREAREILAWADDLSEGNLQRPLRQPHHSATRRAMIGGGASLEPGEVTRAHCGLLLLDELGEFQRETLQALREPAESGMVELSRGRLARRLPAGFLLAATSNGCPCGYGSINSQQRCQCSPAAIRAYRLRLLGPLADRLDMLVQLDYEQPGAVPTTRLDATRLRAAIVECWDRQADRWSGQRFRHNGLRSLDQLERAAPLQNRSALRFCNRWLQSGSVSLRQIAGVRRLALTIADLEKSEETREEHLLEASHLRGLEVRLDWREDEARRKVPL